MSSVSIRKKKRRTFAILAVCATLAVCAAAGFVIWKTMGRAQIELDIHINREAIYLSTYAEPPQFAVWLENPATGDNKQVFVTYRASRGDWEGKADVPVALPRWKAVFRDGENRERDEEEIAVSGATPKDEYFRVRAEVKPGSEWILWIEMNLAGDYNEYYPQFNRETKEEDEFACGQPALLYRAKIRADVGGEYHPRIDAMSLWENGKNTLVPSDGTITSASMVFDEITVRIIKPKPRLIDKHSVEKQDMLNGSKN
jgi:hypothetical protein